MKKTIVRLATFISRRIGAARKPLSLAVLLLACNVPISLAQQSAAQPSGSAPPPIRIEITQPAETRMVKILVVPAAPRMNLTSSTGS
jgi:hypothetical protein